MFWVFFFVLFSFFGGLHFTKPWLHSLLTTRSSRSSTEPRAERLKPGGHFFLLHLPWKQFINLHSAIISFITVQLFTELLLSKQCCRVTARAPVHGCRLPLVECSSSRATPRWCFREAEWRLNAPSSALRGLFRLPSRVVLEDTAPAEVTLFGLSKQKKKKRFRSAANNLKFSNIPQRHS